MARGSDQLTGSNLDSFRCVTAERRDAFVVLARRRLGVPDGELPTYTNTLRWMTLLQVMPEGILAW